MKLRGQTIVITRAPHQAAELQALFEQEGARTMLLPTIEILPPEDWSLCDQAIASAYMYDGILFSSSNGVTGFLERMKTRTGGIDGLRGKKIYVVGEATRKSLAAYGLDVTAMPERFTGADLARTVRQEDLRGLAFLFPTGSLTSTTLADTVKLLGAHVETLIVYRTVAPSPANVREFLAAVRDGKVDIVTFTSPSTVKHFRRLFNAAEAEEVRDRVTIAVIGPTTAEAAGRAGFPADIVAPRSTAEDLVRTVCDHAGTHRQDHA